MHTCLCRFPGAGLLRCGIRAAGPSIVRRLDCCLHLQIARAAAIFNVDEVVVLDDSPDKAPGRVSAAAALFARVLQFMETPQYIKK